MTLTHHNPTELHTSPAFSQGVSSPNGLLFTGGQNGTTADGTMPAGFSDQTTQAFHNLLSVLTDAGCQPSDVMKLNIYIVGDHDVRAGLTAAQQVWGHHPTATTVLRVHGLARPDALIEIEAIAQHPNPR